MTSFTTPFNRDLITEAVKQFDAGDLTLLLELNESLSSEASSAADAILAKSQNRLSERETLLANALFHDLMNGMEMLKFALPQAGV